MEKEKLVKHLREGNIVLLYNYDEQEIAMVSAAEFVTKEVIARMMRFDTGGIGLALHPDISKSIGIKPVYDYLIEQVSGDAHLKNLVKKPSNKGFLYDCVKVEGTGSSFNYKTKAIHHMVDILKSEDYEKFSEDFKIPGHIPFYHAVEGMLETRRGHTELSVALMEIAGLTPLAVICSMADEETGDMMSIDDAKAYGEANGLLSMEEKEVVELYESMRS